MKALVTGVTGFTGRHLAIELTRRGVAVRALVRPRSDAGGLAEHGIELVEGELVRLEDVRRAARGVDQIYHVAAAYRAARHPDRYYWDVNVGGTEHVIDAARREGVGRLVHCSTAGVHGHIDAPPANEQSPLNPGDIYQLTKLEGERRVQDAIRTGVPASVVRPAAIYGPGDLRFLKLFRAVYRGTFRMFGSGRTMYHLVYIDDLVDGIILCGTRPEALGETYILAGPRAITIAGMVELVASALGVSPPRGRLPLWPLLAAAAACERVCRPLRIEPPLHRRRIDFFRKDRAFSIDKAQRALGYRPLVDPEQGLASTAQWYFAEGHLRRDGRVTGSKPGRAVAGGERA